MLSAPTSSSPPKAEPKRTPQAVRSGERGLRVGEGAVTGEPVEIWRVK
jgi:hypothetical protein